MRRFLRHPCQAKLPLLPARGQNRRPAFRPDRDPDRLGGATRLSRPAPPHRLSRSRNRQGAGLPDQQLHRPGSDHRQTVSWPLANRTLLQMAQATSAHQSLLRHLAQRGAHPDRHGHRRLSARRHFENTSASGGQPLHYFKDFEPHALRENAHFTGSGSTAARFPITQCRKPSMFTGFLSGTVLAKSMSFVVWTALGSRSWRLGFTGNQMTSSFLWSLSLLVSSSRGGHSSLSHPRG